MWSQQILWPFIKVSVQSLLIQCEFSLLILSHPFTVSLNAHTSSASSHVRLCARFGRHKSKSHILSLKTPICCRYSHTDKKITRQWKVLQYNYKELLRESRVGSSKDQPEGLKIWIFENLCGSVVLFTSDPKCCFQQEALLPCPD